MSVLVKSNLMSFLQIVFLEIELNLVKLLALPPCLAPGVLLLAIFSPPLLFFLSGPNHFNHSFGDL